MSKARFVAFETLYDVKQMPGQRRDVLPWPYVEGLRMDEAMHPLTILAVGLYGEALPNQDGAPIRLRKLTRQPWLIKFRRLIVLFAFFYATLHFTTYIWLDKFFDFPEMVKDVVKRSFITAGFFAFLLLIPLAATSTAGSIRRLGGRRLGNCTSIDKQRIPRAFA